MDRCGSHSGAVCLREIPAHCTHITPVSMWREISAKSEDCRHRASPAGMARPGTMSRMESSAAILLTVWLSTKESCTYQAQEPYISDRGQAGWPSRAQTGG